MKNVGRVGFWRVLMALSLVCNCILVIRLLDGPALIGSSDERLLTTGEKGSVIHPERSLLSLHKHGTPDRDERKLLGDYGAIFPSSPLELKNCVLFADWRVVRNFRALQSTDFSIDANGAFDLSQRDTRFFDIDLDGKRRIEEMLTRFLNDLKRYEEGAVTMRELDDGSKTLYLPPDDGTIAELLDELMNDLEGVVGEERSQLLWEMVQSRHYLVLSDEEGVTLGISADENSKFLYANGADSGKSLKHWSWSPASLSGNVGGRFNHLFDIAGWMDYFDDKYKNR